MFSGIWEKALILKQVSLIMRAKGGSDFHEEVKTFFVLDHTFG